MKSIRENHKGQWCPFDGRFCQEGLCIECEVYVRRETTRSSRKTYSLSTVATHGSNGSGR